MLRSAGDLSRLATALGGLPVLGCLDGSPAADAGLRYGDVLLALDGAPTRTWSDFIDARARAEGGFVVRIFRDGAELDLAIALRSQSSSPGEVLAELAARFGDDDDSDN